MTDEINPILLDIPPQLETERLILRPPQPGDGAVIDAAVRASLPELSAWMPWAGQSAESSEVFARRSASQYLLRQDLNYMLWRRNEPQFIGMCGVFDFRWDIPSCEIGYWLRTDQHGQGYMTEAVQTVTDFLLTVLKVQRVQILCDSENKRSSAVALRAGYTLEGMRRCDRRNVSGALAHTLIHSRVASDE